MRRGPLASEAGRWSVAALAAASATAVWAAWPGEGEVSLTATPSGPTPAAWTLTLDNGTAAEARVLRADVPCGFRLDAELPRVLSAGETMTAQLERVGTTCETRVIEFYTHPKAGSLRAEVVPPPPAQP